MKKLFFTVSLLTSIVASDMVLTGTGVATGNVCMAAAPNDGTYMRTKQTVSVYNENGHPKGSFSVYIHKGRKYIDFNNTWICIQGKKRFGYRGNWYAIK